MTTMSKNSCSRAGRSVPSSLLYKFQGFFAIRFMQLLPGMRGHQQNLETSSHFSNSSSIVSLPNILPSLATLSGISAHLAKCNNIFEHL